MFKRRTEIQNENNIINESSADMDDEKRAYLGLPMYKSVKKYIYNHTGKRDSVKEEIMKLLKTIELFSGLTEREFKKIFSLCHVREYKKNEYLFHEGNPSSGLFIVKSGKISIQKSNSVEKKSEHFNIKRHDSKSFQDYIQVYAEAVEGDLFGEMSITDDEVIRTTDAVCTEPATLLVLFRHDLFDFFDKEQKLGIKILKNFIYMQGLKLKETNQELLNAKIQNEKLANYINNLQPKTKSADEIISQDFMHGQRS